MYDAQIAALKTALQKYVRPNSVTVVPYIGADDAFVETGDPNYLRSPAGVPHTLNGVSILQYSPYAGTDKNGCPEARARVWTEINTKPSVDRKWGSTVSGLSKRDGAACKLTETSFQ